VIGSYSQPSLIFSSKVGALWSPWQDSILSMGLMTFPVQIKEVTERDKQPSLTIYVTDILEPSSTLIYFIQVEAIYTQQNMFN
jgi:hypothetical protein